MHIWSPSVQLTAESSVSCSGETFRAGDEDVPVVCGKRAVGGAGLSQAGRVGGEVECAVLGGKASLEAEKRAV